MKIAVFETEEWERAAFEGLNTGHEITFMEKPLTPDNADRHASADIVSTFIYSDLSSETLTHLNQLKMIATRSTGFDHIDGEYCKKQGVTVCNVPTYGDNTVAEHVFGLILTISHNLVTAIDRTRRGDFSLQGLRGFDLQGKTLGVIGTGNIGRCVIEIAKGFHMNIEAYDVAPDEEWAAHMGFRYLEMDQVLSEADIITVHVPANKKTHHLLSKKEFGRMKDGVILINTARGSVVDIQALVSALAEKKVAAAGLDVLPEEPTIREESELLRSLYRKRHDLETLLADHILLRLRTVYITPHSAFYTREAVQRILKTTVDNITAFAAGKPQNVVVGGEEAH
jgi:D-lactate dehydrogenase